MTTIHSGQDAEPIRVDHDQTLAAALAAFQAEVPVIPKNKTATVPMKSGGRYTYTYASLADVMSVAGPLLARHGLAFTAIPDRVDDGSLLLVGRLLHTSGETLEGVLPIRGGTPQELGSSITYMRRYLLGCLTGVVTDDDVDGALAERVNQVQGHALRERLGARTPATAEPGISSDQLEALAAGFAEVGRLRGSEVTPDNQAAAFAKWTGREISAPAELTAEEAATVLDRLSAWTTKLGLEAGPEVTE